MKSAIAFCYLHSKLFHFSLIRLFLLQIKTGPVSLLNLFYMILKDHRPIYHCMTNGRCTFLQLLTFRFRQHIVCDMSRWKKKTICTIYRVKWRERECLFVIVYKWNWWIVWTRFVVLQHFCSHFYLFAVVATRHCFSHLIMVCLHRRYMFHRN